MSLRQGSEGGISLGFAIESRCRARAADTKQQDHQRGCSDLKHDVLNAYRVNHPRIVFSSA